MNADTHATHPTATEEAYHAVAAKIAAIPDADCTRITVDIPSTVGIVLATADRLDSLIDAMRGLAGFDVEPVVSLRTYASACLHAYLVSQRPAAPPALIRDANQLKKDMLVSAEALAHYGLVDAARVAALRSLGGHVGTASALVELALLFEEAWDVVKGQTSVTVEMIHRADQLGVELLTRLGSLRIKDHPLAPVSTAKSTRNKAFTLMMRAYDQARRAVVFLRWEQGDVDSIVPTIFVKRRRAAAEAEAEVPKAVDANSEIELELGGSDPAEPGTDSIRNVPAAEMPGPDRDPPTGPTERLPPGNAGIIERSSGPPDGAARPR